jgi:UDP-N-acetylmuramate dehydrogenase
VTATFRELTTMRVGGPTRELVDALSTDQVLDVVRATDAAGVPLLVMGGGSNLVVGDGGWDGVTLRIRSSAVQIDATTVRADAGVDWDHLVALTLAEGLAGLEPLSAIPGTVGGTPVQNVGAYGTETSEVLRSVTVYDRESRVVEEWPNERCRFGTRESVFKHTDRYVVLRVTYELRRDAVSRPLRYQSLVAHMGLGIGDRAETAAVRAAVIDQRRSRGSIVDPDDTDTWGTGSFFLNPILREVPAAAAAGPQYPDPRGVKLAAGWLIEHAGFPRGYGRDFGRGSVGLSSKHALTVCNRGDATTAEVMQFAAHIRAGVQRRFGIRLAPECHLVNCSLDDVPEAVAPHS